MLHLLCLTFGLAFLGGLNLYLTTFLTSVAVSQGWVNPTQFPAFAVLGHPAVMILALILLVVEFLLDKIPWVDSFWDAIHTLIRPAGALALSLTVASAAGLGGAAATAVGLAAVGLALSSHLTKSGLRLIINASPEPFTNILASLVEDAAVVLLALLLFKAPVSGFGVCLALLAGTWIALPRLGRLVKASLYLLWKKYSGGSIPRGVPAGALPAALTVAQETPLRSLPGLETGVASWAVPCASGRSHGLPGHRANRFGLLLSPAGQPGVLVFLAKGWFRYHAVRLSLAGATVRQETSLLSENLVIHRAEDGMHLVFRFTRAEEALVARLVAGLQAGLGLRAPQLEATGTTLPPALPLPAPLSSPSLVAGVFPHSELNSPPPLQH
jgi:hypothetical protein